MKTWLDEIFNGSSFGKVQSSCQLRYRTVSFTLVLVAAVAITMLMSIVYLISTGKTGDLFYPQESSSLVFTLGSNLAHEVIGIPLFKGFVSLKNHPSKLYVLHMTVTSAEVK